MNRMHRMVVVVHAVAAICTASLSADALIRGNVSGETVESTFSFPVRAWASARNGEFLVLGSSVPGNEAYALSVAPGNYAFCSPAAQERALDGHSESYDNPLYNKSIRSISIAEKFGGRGDCLFVTTHEHPENAYLIDNATFNNSNRRVYPIAGLPDATGEKVNGGIVGVTSAPGLLINRQNYVGVAGVGFFAVRGNGQESFGSGDSGIATIYLAEVKTKEMRPVQEMPKSEAQKKEDAAKKAAQEKADAKKRADGMEVKKEEPKMEERVITRWAVEPLAMNDGKVITPVHKDSAFLKIGNALSEMGDVVALCWHEKLTRLYVGVQARSGDGYSDGACALLVGQFTKNGFEFKPVIASDVITRGAGTEIVGTIGSKAAVAIHDIQAMRTSMLLDYLIIVGGNGDAKVTKRSVYALPLLVDPKKCAANADAKAIETAPIDTQNVGCIAAKNAGVHQAYEPTEFGPRLYYAFDRAPHTAEDVVRSGDVQARVGGGPLEYGEIVQTFIHHDSVIVVVRSDDKTLPSGVFVSQPIFKDAMHIAGWTRWKAVATTYQPLIGATVQMASGSVTMVIDAPQATQVKRSSWSDGAATGLSSMVARINEEFSPEQGGVQGMRTLISDSDNRALLAVTGLSKVMLIAHETPSTIFEPGTYQAQVITGGAVSELGAVSAAALYHEGRESRLVVAGVEGLAVSPVLNDSYMLAESVAHGAAFVRCGDYRFVKKVVCDGGYLYVLTDQVLDRIDMRASSLDRNELVRVRLADAKMFADNAYARFNDVIISDHVALLATTQGLFKNMHTLRDAAISQAADLNWQQVDLECDVQNAVSLFAVSATGREEDLARGCGGQLYVLNGFVGNNRARLNRFYVKPAHTDDDLKACIVKLPDSTKGRRYNAYQAFHSYRDVYMQDGILQLSARYTDEVEKLSVRNGFRLETKMFIPNIENGKRIVAVCREPIAGSLLVAGDFGVRVLE